MQRRTNAAVIMERATQTTLELVVSIASRTETLETDLAPYDAVCLGNPYCRLSGGNAVERLDDLPAAVRALRDAGKKAYVTTPAAPRGKDLPHVARLIDAAAAAGADALEVHNVGVLRMLREKGNPLPAHMGAFANVYTHLAARVMKGYGATRVRPNAEVALEETEVIAREAGVEVEILVHGKIPLGVTDRCFLIEGEEGKDPECPPACAKTHWLTTRNWVVKSVGKGVLSGRDMCLLEHLPRVLSLGHRVFRVEGLFETASYRSEIGAVYRDALALASSGPPYEVSPGWADVVRRHAARGLCNGYLFGRAGRTYVGSVLQEETS